MKSADTVSHHSLGTPVNDASPQAIRLRGVHQNNLKGFDIDIPIGRLTVVTGLSGSGKSSLVFDTLHAEGQRRYVETFSPYTRQFMDLLDRPQVDSIENIRPSIAIEQRNSVKTSRSTVGTMTELTDYFKVWFAQVAQLRDPITDEVIIADTPLSVWETVSADSESKTVVIAFRVDRPEKLAWSEILNALKGQGFSRIALAEDSRGFLRIEDGLAEKLKGVPAIHVVQDRIKIDQSDASRSRFIDSATTAFHFGHGALVLLESDGAYAKTFNEKLVATDGTVFTPPTPNHFSFNSPLGACERCRGFGRIIEIDDALIIPDTTLSIAEGAIRPFQGDVYSQSLNDLLRVAKRRGDKLRADVPWSELTQDERDWVFDGDADYPSGGDGVRQGYWYGIRRFFRWLEGNTYKMHVRVFLSKFRAYTTCPDCNGDRLKSSHRNWRWMDHTLPDLYRMPIDELLDLMRKYRQSTHASSEASQALDAILSRLNYLSQVGLGYLNLDRSSRTLSGGETQRVNLTACLGTALVDTLFVLDEPSIGLHARDIDRLISILHQLSKLGNTVVVVEHDEAVMRAADHLIELGPVPGLRGGHVVYEGNYANFLNQDTHTGRMLSGEDTIKPPAQRRAIDHATPKLQFHGVRYNNLLDIDFELPLGRLVALSGVSGSGKSTLLHSAIHGGLKQAEGKMFEHAAHVREITGERAFSSIVSLDQSPLSRTPRSNTALYIDIWDPIRELFARLPESKQAGYTASTFSFNSGNGRCDHCSGLGYEKIEMQFLSDVYVTCPACQGKRFKPDVLEVKWEGYSVADVLDLEVAQAVDVFDQFPKIRFGLQTLLEAGLGYLKLGQPLNTLSGGEAQRVKLIKYLSGFQSGSQPALILLDEPTTGLHRTDIQKLIGILQRLVDAGHSLCVIEHQMDVLAAADWIIELGPGAGSAGGQIVVAATPEIVADAATETGKFLREHLDNIGVGIQESQAAEPRGQYLASQVTTLSLRGAREHNLKNVDLEIPHGQMNVITGVSGSGKSTLAFDIVFAEGQRRFMESMNSYTRQFVEQLPRPDIDSLTGISPTVAIEQRVTRGSRKSTVASITEVAQYLRLLYARIGIQHSPTTGKPILPASPTELKQHLDRLLDEPAQQQQAHLYLCAPVVRGRKGHHQPMANWAKEHGFLYMRCDGSTIRTDAFVKLDRYNEHDIELVVADFGCKAMETRDGQGIPNPVEKSQRHRVFEEALRLGKGSCFLMTARDRIISWFSTTRTDVETGESFPELDPKHFSWNSSRGWCPTCRGHGRIYDWMKDGDEAAEAEAANIDNISHGSICPDCHGTRLNRVSRAVRLHLKDGQTLSLPELLALPAAAILEKLKEIQLDTRGEAIMRDIYPQVVERLKFLGAVGLDYLSLDRATNTLSGGEAQRIRLAAQLGSNLSGVLYVLDEPSIGLHARDNDRLLQTLDRLKNKGNTILMVEHDDDTMRAADHLIDVGPRAGVFGGTIVAQGTPTDVLDDSDSTTARFLREGIPHPSRGTYRTLPELPKAFRGKKAEAWVSLSEPRLRNLKGDSLLLPINRLNVICGPSGAGKSTLIRDVLSPCLRETIRSRTNKLTQRQATDAVRASLEDGGNGIMAPVQRFWAGDNPFRNVIEVDQTPIGKTPRSTPATYLGAFDIIREYYASLPEAKARGLTAGTFSFNTKGGRCETCKGAGRIKLEMAFLADQFVECDDCGGRRYQDDLLEIRWNDKSIADVLEMTFDEAAEFFDFHNTLSAMFNLMVDTGLGYLQLGQSSPTLSGGEAQRLKLVTELAKGRQNIKDRARGIVPRNFYLLEEPTIGLHLSDCARLIDLLHKLVDQGHTVVVIEHHLDIIQEADYVVEMGPNGGDEGGQILYQGALEGLKKIKESPTRAYLR